MVAVVNLVSGGVALFLVCLIIPAPSWLAAGAGWIVAVINSVGTQMINRKAVGASRTAFIGWGIVAHVIRMLTLMGIFAYILISWRGISGSFFVSVFTGIFVLMLVEMVRLLRSQDPVKKDG